MSSLCPPVQLTLSPGKGDKQWLLSLPLTDTVVDQGTDSKLILPGAYNVTKNLAQVLSTILYAGCAHLFCGLVNLREHGQLS